MSKMSMPFGGRTITTTVSGGGGNVGGLLVLAAVVTVPIMVIVAWATQIEIALTVLGVLALVGVTIRPIYVLLRDVTWPWEARRVRAFSAQVDAAFEARAAALEPAAPLRVASARVHELDASAPVFGLNVDREALEA